MKRLVSITVAAAALLSAGCGLTSSPAENITFAAPKSWSSSPGIGGFMQFWRSPRDGEVLMLYRSPKPINTSDVFQSANLKDAQIESRKDLKICDNQPAQEFTLRAKSESNGTSRDIDATTVMTTTGGATYVHRTDTPADPSATAAISELCPKK
jgi:hypothetical protein